MQSLQWMLAIFPIILCVTECSLVKPGLRRIKRWEGNGDMSNMFRGTAGVDYPDLKTIPTTAFRCEDQQYEGGLYADIETQCQVYHICHDGRKDSFLCGKGTIFNQQILACDYWYSTECERAPSFYYINSQIGNSGSSWVGDSQSQPGVPHYNHQANNHGINYKQPNPNTLAERDGRKAAELTGGNSDSSQQENGNSCCCLRNNYKAPWNFPSYLVNQNKR